MNKEFNDIFESINLMHKKYNSKEYIESIDNFSNNSEDLEKMLEKFNTDAADVTDAKSKKKFSIFKSGKREKKLK